MYSIIFQRNKVTNQIGFLYRFTFFLLYGNNAIYAITYRLFSELIKCPFSATQPHGNSVGKRAFQKVAGLGIQRFYFEACLLHGRYYFLLVNALGLHGKYLVLVTDDNYSKRKTRPLLCILLLFEGGRLNNSSLSTFLVQMS